MDLFLLFSRGLSMRFKSNDKGGQAFSCFSSIRRYCAFGASRGWSRNSCRPLGIKSVHSNRKWSLIIGLSSTSTSGLVVHASQFLLAIWKLPGGLPKNVKQKLATTFWLEKNFFCRLVPCWNGMYKNRFIWKKMEKNLALVESGEKLGKIHQKSIKSDLN